jgi:hypothetical protein
MGWEAVPSGMKGGDAGKTYWGMINNLYSQFANPPNVGSQTFNAMVNPLMEQMSQRGLSTSGGIFNNALADAFSKYAQNYQGTQMNLANTINGLFRGGQRDYAYRPETSWMDYLGAGSSILKGLGSLGQGAKGFTDFVDWLKL